MNYIVSNYMNYKVNNWMLLIVNSNQELVTQGVCVSNKLFNTYEEAYENMLQTSKSFAKAKNIETEKYKAFVDCGEYFVQMHIINCSKDIQIVG